MHGHHHYREAKFLRKGERMRDFVFGYNDGAITTIAVLTALTSASVDGFIVVLGALANIFASSISLGFSDYMSVKTQIEVFRTYAMNKKLAKHEREEAREIMSQFEKPAKIAGMATISFMLAGFVALMPFMFMNGDGALMGSIALTLTTVFLIGMVRARYTHGNTLRSGFEMLGTASLATFAAYLIGVYLLAGLGVLYA
jgi:predicted membrane protein (TIGR00267 family)